ncbi:unnamed protein product, partial [Meganyctiphanes norvegica]
MLTVHRLHLLEMIDPSELPKQIQSAVAAGSIVNPGSGISTPGYCVDMEISEDVCGSEGFWKATENSNGYRPNSPLESLDYVERVLAESRTGQLDGNTVEQIISEDISKWQNIEVSGNVTPVLSSSATPSSSPGTGRISRSSNISNTKGHPDSSSSSPSPSNISPPDLPGVPNSSLYNTAKWVLAPEFKPNAFWGQNEPQGHLAVGMNRSIGQSVNNWEPVNPKPLAKCLSEYLTRKNKADEVKEKTSSGVKMLIILRGLPGSGKSTLGRELLGRNGVILSTDDFFCDKQGIYHYDPTRITEAHTWNKRRAQKRLNDGKSPVVIDNTNMEIWEFKPYIKMGLDLGFDIDILEPDTPWKLTPKILAEKNTHGVPKQKIIQMKSRYQQISSLENLLKEVRGSSTKLQMPFSNKNNIPEHQSTKTKSPSLNFRNSRKRNEKINHKLVSQSQSSKSNANVTNKVNDSIEGIHNIVSSNNTSPSHLEISPIKLKENNDQSSNNCNNSGQHTGLSLLQNSYSYANNTFQSDDEGQELDDGPDVIIEDDSDEEQDQVEENTEIIEAYPLKVSIKDEIIRENASSLAEDVFKQQCHTADVASHSIRTEGTIYSTDNLVENFVMPEVTRDDEEEFEQMLIEAELKDLHEKELDLKNIQSNEPKNDIGYNMNEAEMNKKEVDIFENNILSKEPKNDLGDNEKEAEINKKEVEIIIENIQNEDAECDWGDTENETEDFTGNQFTDLVHSFGSALKIQMESKSANAAETPAQKNKDSNTDDGDTAMYEFCNTLQEKMGENLSSLIIRPTNERENYSSLFSIIGNDECKEKEDEEKSMFSLIDTTQSMSINSYDDNVSIDLNQALNTFIQKEENYEKTLDANCNIQKDNVNLQIDNQFDNSTKVLSESQFTTAISSDNVSGCLDSLSDELQTPGTDNNVVTMNSIKCLYENKEQNLNGIEKELLEKQESIDGSLHLENIKKPVIQSKTDISILLNESNKDINSTINENDNLTSWECVSVNAGVCSVDWDANESVKGNETEPRSSKPSRDRRKRTGGDPSKWMISSTVESEPEDPELSSWIPIECGQVSWDAPQNESLDGLKAIVIDNATNQSEKIVLDKSSEIGENLVASEIVDTDTKNTNYVNERDKPNDVGAEEVVISKEVYIPDLKTLSEEVFNKISSPIKGKTQVLSVGQSVSTTSSPLHTASQTGAVPKVKRRTKSQSPNHLEKSSKIIKQQ